MAEILALLAAAVVAVLLFSRLGLGSVLGYLVAGAVIGPPGLALIDDAENMRHIGEFGVVFLLFLIGIEIKPQRLWVMRRLVFGLGGLQVMVTGLLLAGLAHFVGGLGLGTALVVGFGLALSSTAFGVQVLAERNQLTTQSGRASFAILLMQDLAVVPLMMLVPLLAVGRMDLSASMGLAVAEAVAIFAFVLLVGRYAVGPVLHAIAKSRNSDAFVAVALLLVLGFGWALDWVGLSMAMGAFIAGVLLADSEYRHQVEADIQPFRGLLLGLFFMSVGMTIDPAALRGNIALVLGGTLFLVVMKTAVIIAIARMWGQRLPSAVRSGFLLSQGGEFGFVLFSLADDSNLLPDGLMEPLMSVVVLSMALTPLMVRLGEAVAGRVDGISETQEAPDEPVEKPVLIAGFGRVGETVAEMMMSTGVPCVAVDMDADAVARGRKRGFRVYFGNASRPEVLRAIGGAQARLVVITLDDAHAAEGMVRTVRRLYPDTPVHVRAHDWDAADRFAELGAEHAMPETVEASLRLGAAALAAVGVGEDERRALFEDLQADNFAKMRVRPANKG